MKYEVINGQGHLEVAPAAWTDRLPAKHRGRGPRVVRLPNGGDAWTMAGAQHSVPLGLNVGAGKAPTDVRFTGWAYSEGHLGTGDPDQRLRELDEDGLRAEVLFPARPVAELFNQAAGDRDVQLATVQAYNDFAAEYCSHAPNRLLGVAIVPMSGVEDAVAELRRTRKMPGLKGWMLMNYPSGNKYPADSDDKFWAEAVSAEAPLCSLVDFGGAAAVDPDMERKAKGNASPLHSLMSGQNRSPAYTVCHLAVRRVFDRFPGLKIHFAGTGVGWAPYFLEQCDDRYLRHRFAEHQIDPDFVDPDQIPSEYFRQHVVLGFNLDHHGVESRHVIGVENMAWGSGFPHAASEWPSSQRIINEQFRHVTQGEADSILCGNIARHYHLDVG